MKIETIVLYTRRNVGLYALSYLLSCGYTVKVISDDENVLWMAERFGCKIVDLDTMGDFDLLICVHGNRYIPKKYLRENRFINIHPCLNRYKGMDPISRYIKNGDTQASVESHFMTSKIDDGEVIHQEFFETGIVNSHAEFYNQAVPIYFKVIDRTMQKLIEL